MRSLEDRIERIEHEVRFRIWVRFERMLEHLSLEESGALASSGLWPNRPDPAPGMSRLDHMDRKNLIRLWKEANQRLAGRNREEMGFFALHGHWPEQGCGRRCYNSEFESESKQENKSVLSEPKVLSAQH